jgi:hypothetical protein
MMTDYYEVLVTCTGSNIGEDSFSTFNNFEKVFDTAEEVKQWIKEQYEDAKVGLSYIDIKGKGVPCGYVFTFENADWSHAPVERWTQIDWVNVNKVHAECAFEEIKDAIPYISE